MTDRPPPLPNPARRVIQLFIANLVWCGGIIWLLNWCASQGSVLGVYLFLTFALAAGSVVLGIWALVQVYRHRKRTSLKIRLMAWLIVLTPLLLGIGSVIYVLIPHHRELQPAEFRTHALNREGVRDE